MFTAHGSEHALAGFMAIIDAMMSFVKDRGDSLHSMRSVPGPWPPLSHRSGLSSLLHTPIALEALSSLAVAIRTLLLP